MAKSQNKRRAHKTSYKDWLTEEGLMKIEAWARDGLTDEQISHNMGIRRGTLAGYKTRFVEIDEALKKGKEVIDIQVENALFKNATGFYYREQMVTKTGEIIYLEKYAKPDTTAQIFWLKNRKPKEWRDRQDIEHSGHVAVTIVDDVE